MLASRLLSQMQFSLTHVKLADALLLQFCRRVERMYGPSVVTPNMHLHAHIEQCILDYGPVYNFWLFGFERYNGILESFPLNNRCVEIQFMQRFTRETFLYSSSLPQQYESDFHDILSSLVTPVVQGSLQSSFHIPATSNLMLQQEDWTIQMIHQGAGGWYNFILVQVCDALHLSYLDQLIFLHSIYSLVIRNAYFIV